MKNVAEIIFVKPDRYKLVRGVTSQSRDLFLALNILKILGSSSIPIPLLKNRVFAHIKNECKDFSYYQEATKLSDSSFYSHINFLRKFCFITEIGEVVRSSRNGQLYLFLNENQEASKKLKDWEKIFIFYFLIQKDSDFILCLLDLIAETKEGIIEKDIRQKFNAYLLKRLEAKRDVVATKTKGEINQKIRELTRLDSGKKHVNKHSVPIRLEWLIDIGILKRNKKKHTLSPKGKDFYASLISFEENGNAYSDITNDWLNNQTFTSMCLLTNVNLAVSTDKYLLKIKEQLFNFFNKFSSDGAYRLNVETTLLYLIISLIRDENMCIELNNMNELFEKGIETNGLFFIKKEGGRTNESYINIKFL